MTGQGRTCTGPMFYLSCVETALAPLPVPSTGNSGGLTRPAVPHTWPILQYNTHGLAATLCLGLVVYWALAASLAALAVALASASSFSLASTLATFFARVPLFTPCEYCMEVGHQEGSSGAPTARPG